MKDKNYWLVQWRRREERKRVFAEIMGVANGVRRTVQHGVKRMSAVIDSVEYDHDGTMELIEFASLFAHGYDMEEIADIMQLPESAIKAISDNRLLRW